MRPVLFLLLLLGLLALLTLGPRPSRPADPVVDSMTKPSAGPVGRFVRLGDRVPPLLGSSSSCEFGQPTFGASCVHTNGNAGILGSITGGVFGVHPSNNYGFLGGQFYGVYGESQFGPFGFFGDANYGVWGEHSDGSYGYFGGSHTGAFASSDFGPRGALGNQLYGAVGSHQNGNFGYMGSSDVGVYGEHWANGHYGSIGGTFYGARGWNTNDNRGYLGHDSYGVWGTGTPWAGYFQGNVHVTGTLSKGGGSFKIDHPLDPANRYLAHSFVESPDMMNVYNGNVTTDTNGEAVVELPAYFEVLNRDFRYQLTVLGQFAQAIVAEKIRNNRFVIRTDQPNVEVSWQVTGIRQDAWADDNRIVVEEDKPTEERGFYLHPRLYGHSEEQSVAWVRDPEGMRALAEEPARREAQRRQMEQERQHRDEERERMQQEHPRLQKTHPRQ